jgi:hypothetical protein
MQSKTAEDRIILTIGLDVARISLNGYYALFGGNENKVVEIRYLLSNSASR